MNKFLSTVLAVVVVVTTGGLIFAFANHGSLSFGGASGTDHSNDEYFRSGLTIGGGESATTTSTSITIPASMFDTERVVKLTPGAGSLTFTLPATSTLKAFIPYPGDTRTVFFRNATTSVTDITIAGGTGVQLKNASTTAIIQGDTDGSNTAQITFIRKTNGDITALMSLFRD